MPEGAMRVNSKGQVTIPAQLRHKHGLVEGDEVEVVEVDVVEVDGVLRIVRAEAPRRRRAASVSWLGYVAGLRSPAP
jgi:AbrB family looped-hinge helix DNA binding protein